MAWSLAAVIAAERWENSSINWSGMIGEFTAGVAITAAEARLPRQLEGAGDVVGEEGVVGVGVRDRCGVEALGVEGAPAPVGGLDAVGDGDVGVQLGVAGAGVVVVEPGCDQPEDGDPGGAGVAGPGAGDVAFDEPDHGGDRGVVGLHDSLLGGPV